MRHSSLSLPMNIYSDPSLLGVSGPREALPDLSLPRADNSTLSKGPTPTTPGLETREGSSVLTPGGWPSINGCGPP